LPDGTNGNEKSGENAGLEQQGGLEQKPSGDYELLGDIKVVH